MAREFPEAGEILTMKTSPWPLQYFRPEELRCKGSGKLFTPLLTAQRLDVCRHEFGEPMHVVSGYRSKSHNTLVGGAPLSLHLEGRAFDIQWGHMSAARKRALLAAAMNAGFTGFGFYGTFLHMDDGSPRVWVDQAVDY